MKTMKIKPMRYPTSLAVAGLLAAGLSGVHAQNHWDPTIEWDAVQGDWRTDTNWTPANQPGATDKVNIDKDGAKVTLDLGDLSANLNMVDLWLGTVANQSIELTVMDTAGTYDLNLTDGRGAQDTRPTVHPTSLIVGGRNRNLDATVPAGAATFNLEGGTVNLARRLYVGVYSGTGTFNMHGGTIAVNDVFWVGRDHGTGTFNMSGGAVTAPQLHVGREANATGTFNMSAGTLTTTDTADDRFTVGMGGGTGMFNMSGGTLNSGSRMRVGFSGSTGTFLMTGGTLNALDLDIGREGAAQGEFIIKDGTLNVSRLVLMGAGSAGVSGVFTKYGAADVVFDLSNDWRVGWANSNGHGTFRAVIDRTGFIPIDFKKGNLSLLVNGATSVLQVGLDGGVMLSGSNSFDLITMGTGNVTGSWTTVPGQLWTQTTDNDGVSITLDTDFNRGTLDASNLGNQAVLTGPSSTGYIDLTNVNTGSLLQLRLDMDVDSVGVSNLNDLIADLEAAGYSPRASGNHAVVISLDPQANGADYFAWNLSGYTGSGPLEIEAITVVAVAQPKITAFSYNPADGSAEATIEGEPNARFKLVEAADLDFSTPDQDPVPLLGATVGTLFDGLYVITDENGVATVQFNLGTGPATFVRAEETGVITLASFDFEADGQGFIPSGDWEWGTPDSDNGLTGGQVTGGNGGSTGAWATVLGDGGVAPPVNGGITPSTESILRSPDIDLTGVSGARLEFAAAVDALAPGDTLEVIVVDADGDVPIGDSIIPFPTAFPANAAWQDLGPFALPAAANDKTIYLEFRFLGTDANYLGFYLDDVKISF